MLTMGRKSLRQAKKLEIITVFYNVAKKEGLENTSIAKIADYMEINPSLIIHYFRTKEELTYALIEFILEKYLLLFKITNSKTVPLKRILIKVMDDLFSKKWNRLIDDSLFYSCYALTYRNKNIKSQYKNLTYTLRENIAGLFEKCNQAGLIQIDNAVSTANMLFALVDGAYFYLSLTTTTHKDFDAQFEDYKTQAYRLIGITDIQHFLEDLNSLE